MMECPYCGRIFEGTIPKHAIDEFHDSNGPWVCFGSPSQTQDNGEETYE